MKAQNKMRFGFVTILLLLAIVGCVGQAKPTITIISAVAAEPIIENQDVTLHAQASDAKGVTRVDLVTEKGVVSSSDVTPPQKSVTLPLTWKTASGSHTLRVFALNTDNVMSDPASFAVNVMPAPTVAPNAPTSTPNAPTRAATAVLPTATPKSAECVNNARFVSDVSVPDGTRFLPNQAFQKTWRIQNTGTCTWNSKYSLVFASGEAMGGRESAVPVNVPQNNIIDLSVALTSPNSYGVHEGRWQLRDPNGASFGMLTVKINVVSPQPTPCVPQISSFTVDRPTINRGESTTLRWGPVTNAQHVEIDNGIGGVGTPGTVSVAPPQSTTYNLRATCGGNTVVRSVSIGVNQPAPPPPQPTPVPPQPARRNVSGTWHGGDYVLDLSEAMGCSGSDCPVQGTVTHAVMPAPEIDSVSGSINVYSGSMQLAVERPGAGGISCNVNANSTQMSCSGFVGSTSFTK